ncbi:hypothetical protein RPMA_13750 [Tardiphaga alba]|uniref:Uncharacterized protein n=1 Tax=Tardiphaga alba TaxID=340268 RepID=A0ABX8AAU7_9BRAD|nr:hypothetical protein [Tardiphaga alba]QUS39784.1 hypothetical protein RPMA_13750 [Tardiphaga alba]
MSRLICLSLVVAMSLFSADAMAASGKKQKPKKGWQGYGFLPGYRQPLNNAVPLFMQKRADLRMAKRDRRHWYIDKTPQYYNWWSDEWRYPGHPGFYRGQYNGGSFGPCYTRTPIGPIWTCG